MARKSPSFPFAVDPCADGPPRDNLPEEVRLMECIGVAQLACQHVIARHDVKDAEGVLWDCGCPVCAQARGLLVGPGCGLRSARQPA